MAEIAYPPLDVPKAVAPQLWIVDSGPLHLFGIPIPIRMTVIRLRGGDLVLQSPTRFIRGLCKQLEALGPIAHLVAPNMAHWSFLQAWQEHCPAAACWAAPGRPAVARRGVRIDGTLGDTAPEAWSGEIETVAVHGKPLVEIALFHIPSRTLVLTDLVVNLEPDRLPLMMRIGAGLLGSTAPNGRTPLYSRGAFKAGGKKASAAAARLVALDPERLIFSHGAWYERNGRDHLERSLRWLLPR